MSRATVAMASAASWGRVGRSDVLGKEQVAIGRLRRGGEPAEHGRIQPVKRRVVRWNHNAGLLQFGHEAYRSVPDSQPGISTLDIGGQCVRRHCRGGAKRLSVAMRRDERLT